LCNGVALVGGFLTGFFFGVCWMFEKREKKHKHTTTMKTIKTIKKKHLKD
jgi:hypothetical protein